MEYMDLPLKEVDLGKNKCIICFKEIDNDIISVKVCICNKCSNKISILNIDDIEYRYYQNKIKMGIIDKYKLE
jgi:Inhibitor of sigma-G Gin